ncbi:hypothetical protein MPSI1_002601 [Malassezia psittaci]|uniref:Alpha/beta hydrolase fold-3 domain-containing protein n=1 Tax=Malassezia psittaci TaxID=1821823 RepID=A0AAF0JL77_9BASI|nr:hypothetical protein MPSI1_002601 [Malassezia psittaci]
MVLVLPASRSTRPSVSGIRVEHIKIPSRDKGRTIPAVRYSPEGAEGPLPVHVSWQASGWVLRRLGLDKHMHSVFAKRLNAVVIDAAYRKGPEHKYPSAQNDCEDAVAYVLANSSIYDTSRLTVGGSSAGGGMALVTAASFGPSKIRGVFSLYPLTHLESLSDMAKTKKQLTTKYYSGLVFSLKILALCIKAYSNGSAAEIAEPRFSAYNLDVSMLPKHILIACGEADVIYDDSRKMAEKIKREGSAEQKRNLEFMSIPEEAHEFNNFPTHAHSYEWRDKLYDAAIAMIKASWAN